MVTKIYQYLFFCYFVLVNSDLLQDCAERPVNVVIDSTSLTTRADYDVFINIVKNVTSRLQAVYVNNVSINIYPYRNNYPCRKLRTYNGCIRKSIEKLNGSNVLDSVTEYRNLSSIEQYRKYESQPFCLACAQHILKKQLMKESGNHAFGVILTVFPSLKKFIHSQLHKHYKSNSTYVLSLIYNSLNDTANKPRKQPLTSARIISRSYELVDKILAKICPQKFDRRLKRVRPLNASSSVTTESLNQTIASSVSVNGNLNGGFTSSASEPDEYNSVYSRPSVPPTTSLSPKVSLESSVIFKVNMNRSLSKILYDISITSIDTVPSIKQSLIHEIVSSSVIPSSVKPSIAKIEASSVNSYIDNQTMKQNKTLKKSILFGSSVVVKKVMPSSVFKEPILASSVNSYINNQTIKQNKTLKKIISFGSSVVVKKVMPSSVFKEPILASSVDSYIDNQTIKQNKTLKKSISFGSSVAVKKVMPSSVFKEPILQSINITGQSVRERQFIPNTTIPKFERTIDSKTHNSISPSFSPTIVTNATKVLIVKSFNQTKIKVTVISPSMQNMNKTKALIPVPTNATLHLLGSTTVSHSVKGSIVFNISTSMMIQSSTSLRNQENSSTIKRKIETGQSIIINTTKSVQSSSVHQFSSLVIKTSLPFSIVVSKSIKGSISFQSTVVISPWNSSTLINQSIKSLPSIASTYVFVNQTKSFTESALSVLKESLNQSSKVSIPRISSSIFLSKPLTPSSNLLMKTFSSATSADTASTYQPASILFTNSSFVIDRTMVKETLFLITTSISTSSNVTLFTSTPVLIPKIPVKKVLEEITVFMEQNITIMHMKQEIWVEKFIANTSTLLNDIEKNEDSRVNEKSLNFLSFVEQTTLKIGQRLPIGTNITLKKKDLDVDISAVSPNNFAGYIFVPNTAINSNDKIQLSPNIFKNSSNGHRKISITTMFMKTVPAMRHSLDSFQDIGKVFTISLDVDIEHSMTDLVSYTFEVPENNFSNYKCVYWNYTDWDTTGCVIANISGVTVECQCNHMTSFSLLMQVSDIEIDEIHAFVLSIITYIGCSISIVGCVLLLLVYVMFGRLLKVSRNIIHMNLALAIVISNALFISADSVHMYKGICLTVSIAMLYSYLASFFWMLVEGIHVYLLIVKVFKSPSMMKVYCIIGWIVPAVIVAIAGLKFHVNFTRDDFCWISTEGSVIWVFVGPVLSIVVINGVILITALSTSYKMAVAETDFLRLQQVARLTMLLMPIFGLTWVFGLLAINKQLIIFQYIFTIINSLQGVYIFICYCLLNNEVKQEFERIRRKYQYDSGNTVSSDSNYSVYDQLFHRRIKNVVSVDSSSMVKLTKYDAKLGRFDSVKTESTRVSYSDTLTKRLNKDYSIELINLNDASNMTSATENDTQSMSSSVCPEEHEYGIKLNYEEVPLTNGHYSCGDFDTFRGKK